MNCCPTCGQSLPPARLVLDRAHRILADDQREIRISSQGLSLLIALVRGAPRVVPHDQIIQSIWGDDEPEHPTNTVKVLVHRLRPKLARFGLLIRNAHGVGYALEGPAVALGELKALTPRRAA